MARVLNIWLFQQGLANPFLSDYIELRPVDITYARVTYTESRGVTLEVEMADSAEAEGLDGSRASGDDAAIPWYFWVEYRSEGYAGVQQALLFYGRPANRRSYLKTVDEERSLVVFEDALASSQRACAYPLNSQIFGDSEDFYRLANQDRSELDDETNVYFDTSLWKQFFTISDKYNVPYLDPRRLPDLPIAQIEYSPDVPVWQTIGAWIAEFEPIVAATIFDGRFERDIPTTEEEIVYSFATKASEGKRSLIAARYFLSDIDVISSSGAALNQLPYSAIEAVNADFAGERVNLVKVLHGPPPAPGAITPDIEYTERREDDPPSTGADNRTTVTGRIFWDLHEDPEDEEKITRTVFMGLYSNTFDAPQEDEEGNTAPGFGEQIEATETRQQWADDFQRLTDIYTTTGARVDLPAVGTVYWPNAQRQHERTEWQRDPLSPAGETLWIKKKVERTVSGLAIVVNDGEGAPILRSGVDVLTATRSRTVDTSATSSQRWVDTTLWIATEVYQPLGVDTVACLRTERDALRGTPARSFPVQIQAKSSIRAEPAPILDYRDDTFRQDDREIANAARIIDARLIGDDLADYLVDELFHQDEIPEAIIRVPPVWLEPGGYQQGTRWSVTGEGGEEGHAMVTEIVYEFRIDPELRADQKFTLLRGGKVDRD